LGRHRGWLARLAGLRINRALIARITSIDTHKTSGSYTFKVAQ